jgi:hypothetical protein
MPNKVCNVFQRSTVYSHPACKHVLQVVPPKILDLRVNHCVVRANAARFQAAHPSFP